MTLSMSARSSVEQHLPGILLALTADISKIYGAVELTKSNCKAKALFYVEIKLEFPSERGEFEGCSYVDDCLSGADDSDSAIL